MHLSSLWHLYLMAKGDRYAGTDLAIYIRTSYSGSNRDAMLYFLYLGMVRAKA